MMSDIFLYDTPILPSNFVFPQSYIDTVSLSNMIDIEPWSFLCRDMGMSLSYYGSLLITYKDHPLIPFAIADDQSGLFNDGYIILACFDGCDKSSEPKIYFHDYGHSGKSLSWDKRYHLNSFAEWIELAKKESAQYKIDRA